MHLELKNALKGKKKYIRFHMPGHKASKKFERYFRNFSIFDTTEISGLDNLQNPQGLLKNVEQNIANFYGAKCGLLLSCGTTQGIFISVYSIAKENKTLAILKNTHTSFYNACEVFKVNLLIFDTIEQLEQNCDRFDAVALTAVDYFGVKLNINFDLLKQKNILTIIDAAHAPHLYDQEFYKKGDIVLTSMHKFLPCLTQGAMLFLNSDCRDKFINIRKKLSTTSPSYLIMASIEYSVFCLSNYSRKKLEVLKKKYLSKFSDITLTSDYLRIVLNVEQIASGYELEKYLEKQGINIEFATQNHLVLFLGLDTGKKQLAKLSKVLGKMRKNFSRDLVETTATCKLESNFVLPFSVAVASDYKLVAIEDCEGEIATQNVGNYPPSYPVICAGERITQQHLNQLNGQVFGLENGKIKVLKNAKSS